MNAELQAAAGIGQAELYPEIHVRNLDVIDYLANLCKWCDVPIFDSFTKPRSFCNNGNVCCNNYSRRGVSKKVWEALKRAKRELVVKDKPSFVDTMVNTIIKNARGDEIEVIRLEPMRLFPSEKKQRGGVGVCPKGKELGVNAPVPEPTPLFTGWERGDVVIAPRRRSSFQRKEPKRK